VYQRSTNHANKTIKATAERAFTTPRKKSEEFNTRLYREKEEQAIEQRIQEQRSARLKRDAANPPTKQQRQRSRSNLSSNATPPPTTTT
jgi:hypothetical protein